MREADKREVWAAGHLMPYDALDRSMKVSIEPLSGLVDGEAACMFGVGVSNALSRQGVPWLLTSDLVEEHAMAFLRRSKRWVASTKREYDLLLNFVDARNTMAVRWLGWLGFRLYPAEPYGVDGLPFHLFEMECR